MGVALGRTSRVIRIHAALIKARRVVIRPTPKHAKMNARSSCMPSTAASIDPSLPRSALPEPHTETNVVDAVHSRFEQMEMVTHKCRHACEKRDEANYPVLSCARHVARVRTSTFCA